MPKALTHVAGWNGLCYITADFVGAGFSRCTNCFGRANGARC
jgi:hypothetical protein